MKKYIVLLVLFVLTSCGASQSEIDQAKNEILNNTGAIVDTGGNIDPTETETPVDENVTDSGVLPNVEVNPISTEQFLEINPISESSILDGEVEISGKVLKNVDTIEVSFTNTDSLFPDDTYTLQTFKSGDTSFKYIASSNFQVLDFGENIYTIKATSGKDVAETQIIIRFKNPADTQVSYQEQVIGTEDDSVILDLPTSAEYGKPLSLGVNSITYSNINSFEIEKKDVAGATCEGLTEYLQSSIGTWFYWNTCRDIVKDKGISFYVIRLDAETYTYQKHYIDFEHSFYGIYDIETGTGIDKETIADKNTELKDINDTFEKVSVVDGLMKKIVNQK